VSQNTGMHVEELFIAYYPDGSRAGEFASEVEALRFLYREACARLGRIPLRFDDLGRWQRPLPTLPEVST
jgi:hypothetical protein